MIKASPFHRRAADLNQDNAWAPRNGVTLSRYYSSSDEEALAARASCVVSDVSFRAFFSVSGADAAEYLSRLATQSIAQLNIGDVARALWLDDTGGIKGRGAIARLGREYFVIDAQSGDDWIEAAAAVFRVSLARAEAGLVLIGPMAQNILAAAGLSVPDTSFAVSATWRGLELMLLSTGIGTQIRCRAGDAEMLWDILFEHGQEFGLVPAGLDALDILEMETRRPDTEMVDANHAAFNGRSGFLAAQARQASTLIGIDIDADTAAPYAQLLCNGALAGTILSSLYSPALGRAIALAEVDKSAAAPGTEFTLSLPPDARHSEPRKVAARAAALPFLPV